MPEFRKILLKRTMEREKNMDWFTQAFQISTMSELLNWATLNATKLFNCPIGVLLLLEENKLIIKSSFGIDEIKIKEIPIGESFSGRFIKIGQPKIINCNEFQKNIKNNLEPYYVGSLMSIPLIFNKVILGLLNLCQPDLANPFSYEDLMLGLSYSNQTAFAITSQKLVESQTEKLREAQKHLMEIAHQEGMAEIAIGVLHNIGNIVNSISISSEEIIHTINTSKIEGLIKANELLLSHKDQLDRYIKDDPKGKLLPEYYIKVGEVLKKEYEKIEEEAKELLKKVKMIKDVIITQQDYSNLGLFIEKLNLLSIIEDVLKVEESHFTKYNIKIEKRYSNNQNFIIRGQKSKIFHILLNLLKNASDAVRNNDLNNRLIILQINQDKEKVYLNVIDNGIGIVKENLTKIFNYGFTTKKDGHGFGLHSCANFMAEMGGKILAESEGLGKGSTFTLIFSKT